MRARLQEGENEGRDDRALSCCFDGGLRGLAPATSGLTVRARAPSGLERYKPSEKPHRLPVRCRPRSGAVGWFSFTVLHSRLRPAEYCVGRPSGFRLLRSGTGHIPAPAYHATHAARMPQPLGAP